MTDLRKAAISVAIMATLMLGACAVSTPPGSEPSEPAVTNPLLGFPELPEGKGDVFGRALVGVAAPYEPDLTLSAREAELRADMALRRQVGWEIVERVIDNVPLLGLAELSEGEQDVVLNEGELPQVPRWQTWYGVDDVKRMLHQLLSELGPDGRAQRQPFSAASLDAIEGWNAAAHERSSRWPLERLFNHIGDLGLCPEGTPEEQCALSLQSNFSGATGGNARVTYSPDTVRHILENYTSILSCVDKVDAVNFDTAPAAPDLNFSTCFDAEFPPGAVLTKAHWVRADFDRGMPAYDTDATTLASITDDGMTGDWGEGQRQSNPSLDRVFTIQLRNGDTYRLAGLHVMTKELRHWTWVTLWWSDKPDMDFGADRPARLSQLNPVWSNYKMGVVVDYIEGDPDPGASFIEHPSLMAAIQSTQRGVYTWLSNPYIEHGQGNAKTNCIGCHQHGGATMGHDLDGDGQADPFSVELVITAGNLFPDASRSQMRTQFPNDYLWSMQRIDDLAGLIRREVAHFDALDAQINPAEDDDAPSGGDTELDARIATILDLSGDHLAGAATFSANCTGCHGAEGSGGTVGPSLYKRVPALTTEAIVEILLTGRSPMPSWSVLSDQELADVLALLQRTFGE